jgi:protein phosphatase
MSLARKLLDLEPTLRMLRPEPPPEPETGTTHFEVAAHSDPGRVHATNGDQYLVAELDRQMRVVATSISDGVGRTIESPPGLLMAVADGLEEVRGGDVASAVAIDALVEHAVSLVPWLGAAWASTPDVVHGFRGALEECQDRLRSVAAREGLDIRLATTLTAAYVTWPLLHIVHVGDSRCYLYRHGALARLTRDQTLAQQLIDAGEMDEMDMRRSLLRDTLTSAIGGVGELELEVDPVVLRPRDVLLLCTDGLYEELGDHQIRRGIEKMHGPEDVERCVHHLIDKANHAGGRDNVTVAMVAFS